MNVHNATEVAYRNGYEKGKTDAAREIIEEIAPRCAGKVCYNLDFTMGYLTAMNKVLAELAKIKHKYTEGTNE